MGGQTPHPRKPRTPKKNAGTPFVKVGLGSLVAFFGGVFCLFAPLPVLMTSTFVEQRDPLALVLVLLVSGAVAVAWAMSRVVSTKMIAAGVGLTLLLMLIMMQAVPLPGRFDRAIPFTTFGGVLVALIVAGYVLIVFFIAGEGTKSLRMQTELDLAQRIHASLTPEVSLRAGCCEVFGASAASAEMGGDLLDVVEHGGGVDVFLADVSGHGVRAGVGMAMVKSALRMRLGNRGERPSLGELATDLNRVMHEVTEADMFATLASVRIMPGGEVEYALAGHHAVLLCRADGRVEELCNEALPLGVIADERVGSGHVRCEPGDVLALYTDGLSEAFDASGRVIGEGPVRAALVDARERGARGVHDAIVGAVGELGRQADDQTLVIVKIVGGGASCA